MKGNMKQRGLKINGSHDHVFSNNIKIIEHPNHTNNVKLAMAE